jgi:hypothetical protein
MGRRDPDNECSIDSLIESGYNSKKSCSEGRSVALYEVPNQSFMSDEKFPSSSDDSSSDWLSDGDNTPKQEIFKVSNKQNPANERKMGIVGFSQGYRDDNPLKIIQ